MDESKIVAALSEIATKNWRKSPPSPTYLSALPRLLQEQLAADYKPALNGETLKSFIQRTEAPNFYKLIAHPTQRAKLAIVPFGESFSFEDGAPESESPKLTPADVASFQRILQSLPPQILGQWTIPAELVLRLISGK